MIARSYKFRLYPTPDQAARLGAWQVACHDVQRLCVQQRRMAYNRLAYLVHGGYDKKKQRDRWYKRASLKTQPTWSSQSRETTELRRAEELDVPADTLAAIVKRVDLAYANWRKRIKNGQRGGRPRWADKPEQVGLVFRGQVERGTRLVGQTAKFGFWQLAAAHSLGVLKVRMHRPLPAGAQVQQAHITRAADGWYIAFSCEIPDPTPLPATDRAIGVDVGCIHERDSQRVAVVDDERIYRTTDQIKRNARRLATLQKLVSPKRRTRGTAKAADPESKRTAKRRAKIARLHQRIARQREHTQQYIAKRLVDTAQVVTFERLNHHAMRRRGKGRRKRGLNRALSTAAPGKLIALVEEKAQAAGRTVVKVDARNTSQACSACGALGEKKALNIRSWRCAACGAEHDRDVNAARNIRQRDLAALAGVEPTFRGGLRGESRAVSDSERGPMNREGAQAPAGEQRRSTLKKASRSAQKQQQQEAAHGARQLTLFDSS